jgi:hypothetical protein
MTYLNPERWQLYSQYFGVDGRIILKWILRKWDGRAWIEFMWLKIGTGNGALVNTVMIMNLPVP